MLHKSGRCLAFWLALGCCVLELQESPASARPNEGAVRLRVLSTRRRETVHIAGSRQPGGLPGNWLVLTVEITSPEAGTDLEGVKLVGTGLAKPLEPRGIAGEAAPTMFLGFGDQPGLIEHWARLSQGSAYFGAGYMGADGQIRFILTLERHLLLQKTGAVVVTLLFDVPRRHDSYTLRLGDLTVDVRLPTSPGAPPRD